MENFRVTLKEIIDRSLLIIFRERDFKKWSFAKRSIAN